ncbi:UNVERIFIED_CONTAM: Techylectin-like protein [Trichonephila clavipes]
MVFLHNSKVIQRRGDFGNAQNYFDKTWKDYKEGFGTLKREFWLGDAISTHNNRLFYTKDQHNIPPDRKRSSYMHTGGWWFNVFPSSNLNALNNNGEKHTVVEKGMAWSTFGRYNGTITFTEIKLRLKNQ